MADNKERLIEMVSNANILLVDGNPLNKSEFSIDEEMFSAVVYNEIKYGDGEVEFKTSLEEDIRVEDEVFWLKDVYGDEYSVKEIQ